MLWSYVNTVHNRLESGTQRFETRTPGELYRPELDPEQGYLVVTGPAEPLQGEEPAPFPVKRAVLEDLGDYPFPSKILVPHSEIVHDRVSMEIARGCTEGCRFCQAGIIYRPVRERSPKEIIETTLKSLDETGYDEVTLSALSVAELLPPGLKTAWVNRGGEQWPGESQVPDIEVAHVGELPSLLVDGSGRRDS